MAAYQFFLTSLCWIIGIGLSNLGRLKLFSPPFYLWIGFVLLILAAIGLKGEMRKWSLLLMGSLLAGACYFSWYDSRYASELVQYAEGEELVFLQGKIDSPVERDGDLVRFYARINNVNRKQRMKTAFQTTDLNERVLIRLKLQHEEQINTIEGWHSGNSFQGQATIKLPGTARNPHAFDYRSYLRYQKVAVIVDMDVTDMEVEEGEGDWRAFFTRWQKEEARQLEKLSMEPENIGFFKSLLLGQQSEVEADLQTVYADLGFIHVLAISGLHITIVSSGFLWIVQKIGVPTKISYVIGILFILMYVGLVGMGVSAVRSGCMGILGLLARSQEKSAQGLEILGVTGLIMLIYDPYQLFHLGFQLSFFITMGLLVFVPLLVQLEWPMPKWLVSTLAVTLVSQLISFPFLIHYFHLFSPISWLVNVLLVPVYSYIILPLGYILLFFSHIHIALTYIPSVVADYLLSFVHSFLTFLHQTKIPLRHWSHPVWWWHVLYMGFCVGFWAMWHLGYHRKKDLFMATFLLILLVMIARDPWGKKGEVEITIIDVGQGDSIIVEIDNSFVYVIDAGGTISFGREPWQKRRNPFEVGKDVVVPYLRSKGVERINCLVLTHGDHDHVGGVKALLPALKVDRVLTNGRQPKAEAEWVQALHSEQIKMHTGYSGYTWQDNPQVTWTWLSPDPKRTQGSSENNASVVLLLSAYGVNILLTGDLEESGEQELLRRYTLPPIDLLKVGHHGSKTSSSEEFLHAITPSVSLISVGTNNRYHHPSEQVIERFKQRNTQIYRTDHHGAITVTINENGYKVTPTLQPE
ncbi:DNA internalization-related competence protein ComEC/Rec2 [Brevibacillus laterosporus]|uniref:DNA internalization-related competence protein ComEC/Rec2 n=1 Tax=Brevibacillus laterosporus TaxID=1465 RepID=UPI000BD2C0BE|nr:DNA internalization-related competence protein ComEC/Rec2 [Brevibacillus laterosporus]PCN44530.1 DNA internalization-related competence protein ComEC/Rec2 [Brevibacillus laterosporus]